MTEKNTLPRKATPAKVAQAEDLFEVKAQEEILKASKKSMETREGVYRGLAKR